MLGNLKFALESRRPKSSCTNPRGQCLNTPEDLDHGGRGSTREAGNIRSIDLRAETRTVLRSEKGLFHLNVTRSIVSGKSFSSKRSEGEFVMTLCAGTKSIDRFRKSRMRSRRILNHSLANKSSVAVTLTLNDAVMNIVIWSRLK